MKIVAFVLALAVSAVWSTPGDAGLFKRSNKSRVQVTVSLSEQKMFVVVSDRRGRKTRKTFVVSTGADGFETPTGTWRASWMAKDHKSDTYDGAPMPNSVFFAPGYAIHGTAEVSKLGQRASHGCVRLRPADSEYFFQAVSEIGMARTKITIVD